jgi:hypothetical protein
MLGPLEVLSVGSNLRYCKIQLPDSWKIQSSFHIDLLKRYKGTDPKKPIIEIEAEGQEWTMESIIASGPSDDNFKHYVFLVKWKEFTQEENTWEIYQNVAEHNLELLKDFDTKNPMMEKDERFGERKGKRELGKKKN